MSWYSLTSNTCRTIVKSLVDWQQWCSVRQNNWYQWQIDGLAVCAHILQIVCTKYRWRPDTTYMATLTTVFTAQSLVPRSDITYRIRVRVYRHVHYKQATVTVDQWLMLKNNGITFSAWHLANAMWFARSLPNKTLNAASVHLRLIF
jgi:hypothetical protein